MDGQLNQRIGRVISSRPWMLAQLLVTLVISGSLVNLMNRWFPYLTDHWPVSLSVGSLLLGAWAAERFAFALARATWERLQ